MTLQVPFLELSRQWATVGSEVMAAVTEALSVGPYILGPRLEKFERAFADYCGTRHAIGVSTGTEAIRLGLQALDIGPGDEVITTPLTAAFTSLAILLLGARPVFADVNPVTYNIEPHSVKALLTSRTKAILPVHLHGRLADIEALAEIAHEAGIPLLEDACQAHGARLGSRQAGSWGIAGAFSFYPTKNLGGYGDGGMVVTNNDELASHVRMLRTGGQRKRYWHEEVGTASRLDELQAAVLHAKLPHLERWIQRRRSIAARYQEALCGLPIQLPPIPTDGSHVFHLYVVRTPERDSLISWLTSRGVGVDVYYPHPLHLQPVFTHLGYSVGDFPQSESACREILALPCYPELRSEEQELVCEAVTEFFSHSLVANS
jgi:dTDP-4-amino-4,6-dideoxygalactose transaminase